jgi:hypothetical protein
MALTRVKKVPTANLVQGSSFLTSVAASNLPAGSTLQVVHRDYNPLLSTSSTSFIDITNYNVTITPSSTSNKILLIVNPTFSINGHGTVRLTRSIGGATATTAGFVGDQEVSSRTPGTFHQYTNSSFNTGYDPKSAGITFFDSPNTTSAVVYQVQVAVPHSATFTAVINRPVLDGDANWSTRLRSSMTAIEVKQ